MALQEDNKLSIWMNDVKDIINFTIWGLQRCITNHKKAFQKCI